MNCWYELVRVAVQQLLTFLSRVFFRWIAPSGAVLNPLELSHSLLSPLQPAAESVDSTATYKSHRRSVLALLFVDGIMR